MDKRKAVKGKDKAQYAHFNNQIKKKCRVAKENFLKEKCEEIEELNEKNKTKNPHQQVKLLIGKGRSSRTRGNIKYRSGKLLFEKEKKYSVDGRNIKGNSLKISDQTNR